MGLTPSPRLAPRATHGNTVSLPACLLVHSNTRSIASNSIQLHQPPTVPQLSSSHKGPHTVPPVTTVVLILAHPAPLLHPGSSVARPPASHAPQTHQCPRLPRGAHQPPRLPLRHVRPPNHIPELRLAKPRVYRSRTTVQQLTKRTAAGAGAAAAAAAASTALVAVTGG